MAVNPFDRTSIGYDVLFGDTTVYYHVSPLSAGGDLMLNMQVPVLALEHAGLVRMGTVAVVVLGFAWVCWALLRQVQVPNKTKKG